MYYFIIIIIIFIIYFNIEEFDNDINNQILRLLNTKLVASKQINSQQQQILYDNQQQLASINLIKSNNIGSNEQVSNNIIQNNNNSQQISSNNAYSNMNGSNNMNSQIIGSNYVVVIGKMSNKSH